MRSVAEQHNKANSVSTAILDEPMCNEQCLCRRRNEKEIAGRKSKNADETGFSRILNHCVRAFICVFLSFSCALIPFDVDGLTSR